MVEIKGFENYLITIDCDVINRRTGRVLKQCISSGGYNIVQISGDTGVRTKTIHKMMYETFTGCVPEGLELNHIDGNKSNNRITNLELVTHSENMQKAVITGNIKSGINCNFSKSVEQIDVLNESLLGVYGSIRIAEKSTGVSSSSISNVCNNKRTTAGGFKWRFSS